MIRNNGNGFNFKRLNKDKKTRARRGVIHTPHGDIQTPAFSPVGTKATVKSLDPIDLINTNSQVVLANAYHLYLKPGLETLEKFGGFAPFMGWKGPSITDSGGYQVSFMYQKPSDKGTSKKFKITDYGLYFYSHLDGSKHFLTPALSMEIQSVLGADIIMALDQPMGFGYSKLQNEAAYNRTFKWEEESFNNWSKRKGLNIYGKYQALFGIIQGQTDKKKRKTFLDFIISTGFPGIAIGDETIGSDPRITAESLDTIVDFLPDDKPLHALGLGGGPEGIFEAVERGVDIFDNSSVTRMARTGLLFISPEEGGDKKNKFRLNILKSSLKEEKGPVDKKCKCYTCGNFTRGYLNHLLTSGEILGSRLATIHNVAFINSLMNKIRGSIEKSDFTALKKHWLD